MYDIIINQILLFDIVEFTHLNFHELPHCLITKLLKQDFGNFFTVPCYNFAKIG